MKRLTATQHLNNALADLVKARNAEPDAGYKLDIQVMIDDLITELRSRRAISKPGYMKDWCGGNQAAAK